MRLRLILLSAAGLAAAFLLITGYDRLTSGLVMVGAAVTILLSLRRPHSR